MLLCLPTYVTSPLHFSSALLVVGASATCSVRSAARGCWGRPAWWSGLPWWLPWPIGLEVWGLLVGAWTVE
ncbi:hypothetical protein PR003_g23662 [Phytophthora rubi]|uniref:Uncharacterized protein n=1 Tax=Phytophthora rubi TaxID=129364 RepID=A0A6A3JSE2_9STRA|nr:hypothetical protein PR001_g27100 [Phytophthora rubi]KAE8970783.1 hypothetical protein PR001_g27101 [Phytophthora rubi]KAE8997761.1 hypothetical protein PR002_g18941 [Phytophthora rubi]KAE8997762.1 hypothetical protein PR002_g18940 [Phytophthora rubi]KAE9296829.1 hypothetical protein PR003_g23661 [Phytophthora rubi]